MDQGDSLIKTILVTGFLGAGKTTVINRLIDDYLGKADKLAVMINEFGSIGIDGALVPDGDFYKIELNKGSIFCVCMRTDFIAELKSIAEKIAPDILLIEATGIARVDDMYAMMRLDGLDKLLTIEKNICVIDAAGFHKVEATLEAVRIQAEYADAFILNKVDLASEQRLEETIRLLRKYNQKAPILPAEYGETESDALEKTAGLEKKVPESCSDSPPEDFFSFSVELENPLDRDKWLHFINDIKHRTLRGKGVLQFTEGPVFFEIINGEYTENKTSPGLNGNSNSKIVLIRNNMLEEELAKRIKDCTI